VERTHRPTVSSAHLSSVLAELVIATAATIALMLVIPATNDAKGTYCTPIHGAHAEVRHLSISLGCSAAGKAALRTIESNIGYFKSHTWYCRWGQGGTRPIRLGRHIYSAGFCVSKPSYREVTFLGRRIS